MGIFVVGMHRSGTSVLSRVVGLMVGHDGYRGEAFDNVEGHWEDPRMNRALELALGAVNADWVSPPLDPLWSGDPRLGESSARIRAIIDHYGDGHWVLKDPRVCLCLEYLLTFTRRSPVVVAIYRDPVEVADSLALRSGLQFDYGLALWEIYCQMMIQQIRASGLPSVWISYAQLWSDPSSTIDRLAAHFAEQGLEVDPAAAARARVAVNPSLRHHESSERGHEGLSKSMEALWRILRSTEDAGSPPLEQVPAITHWAKALVETRRPFIRMDADNRYLTHRLRRVRPVFRAYDKARLMLHPDGAKDPFERYL
jgi:hypothetical protein